MNSLQHTPIFEKCPDMAARSADECVLRSAIESNVEGGDCPCTGEGDGSWQLMECLERPANQTTGSARDSRGYTKITKS